MWEIEKLVSNFTNGMELAYQRELEELKSRRSVLNIVIYLFHTIRCRYIYCQESQVETGP